MADSRLRRPLTTVSGLYVLALLAAAVAFAESGETPSSLAGPGLHFLRGARLLSLGVTVLFVLPLLVTLEALLQRGHDHWIAPLRPLGRMLVVLAVVMAVSLGLELILFGRQRAFFLGICTYPFWIAAIIGVIIVIIVLANGERLSITLTSSTGAGPVFREVTSGIAEIDLAISAGTDRPSDAPVTVVINSVVVDTAPGQGGNVQSDVTAVLTMGGQASATATAANANIGTIAQSIIPGLSELTVTVTATCAAGHSKQFGRMVRCQK